VKCGVGKIRFFSGFLSRCLRRGDVQIVGILRVRWVGISGGFARNLRVGSAESCGEPSRGLGRQVSDMRHLMVEVHYSDRSLTLASFGCCLTGHHKLHIQATYHCKIEG
jgi:hypothetical protein